MYKRFYDKATDYGMFCGWWSDWGWSAIPAEFLPECGIVIGDDIGDICAVFLYRTDTPIVWIENYISDKNAKGDRRSQAMDMLIKEAQLEASTMGAVAMSSVRHNGLAKRLSDNGFVKADEGLTNYIWGAS